MSTPRRRVVEAPSRNRPEVEAIRIVVDEDPDSDPSYLDQDEFEDRREAYRRGEFGFVGVRAEADVRIEGIAQTLTSGGLYEIESDSGDEYFSEVFSTEWAALRDVLKAVGVSTARLPVEVDRDWIEWRT
jgi:hypothetical protein